MPIGKNSIKRALNNGYSNVVTSAPDMENSVILEEKKPAAKKAAKNPAPKGITSAKAGAGIKNSAPKGALSMEGVKKTTVKKPASKKKAPVIIQLTEEERAELFSMREPLYKTEEPKNEEKKADDTLKQAKPEAKNAKQAEEKASDEKPAPKKSMESEPMLSPVKTAETVTESIKREGEGYTNLGGTLPVYLL